MTDVEPSRVTAHLVVTGAALTSALDQAVPKVGDGSFRLLGGDRRYDWRRDPLEVSFSQGRIVIAVRVHATVALPLQSVEVPLDVRVEAEPVVTSEYAVKLQSVQARVTSDDTRLAIAERLGGIYETIGAGVEGQLKAFAYDLKPLLSEANSRLARPTAFSVGEAAGCARLRVLEVEAGPTVLSDGIEKDVAMVVAPSVTLPCDVPGGPAAGADAALPPLFNVASIASGPFTVTIPLVATYAELTRAMSMAFTDGKLFFSADYPGLYLEHPELYESQGQVVLKLHIAGPVRRLGIDADLDGDLYLTGHPAVVDNELRFPDLEPTIETRNFLLSLKAISDSDRIRDQARSALRLDLGARLREARQQIGDDLTFERLEPPTGCFQGMVDGIAVTGLHWHADYVRVYVAVTARARVLVPCPMAAPLPLVQ